MDEAGLPSEVIEAIFKYLPTVSLLRFTAVCKQWKEIISTRILVSEVPMRPNHEHWLLMISDGLHLGKVSAYNPAWHKWHSISLPTDSNNRFPFAVAADGNLVCMSDRCFRKFGTYGRVAVCDPLLKLWHELPPLRSWGVIQGMKVDLETKSVKILATNFLDSDNDQFKLTCAELYDSLVDEWKIIVPPNPFLAADCCCVFCDSRFFFLDPDDSLFAFDIKSEVWVKVPTSSLPQNPTRTHRKLIVCNNQILLVTVEMENAHKELMIWGLSSTMKWEKVATPPPLVSYQFFNEDGGDNDQNLQGDNHDSSLHGYSSTRRWTASGEIHEDVFRVWANTLGRSSIYLKNSLVPQLLHVDLEGSGEERWKWVVCPHHVPISARPFKFSI